MPRVSVDRHTVQLRGKKHTTSEAIRAKLAVGSPEGRRASLVVGELTPQPDNDAYESYRGTNHPHDCPELEILGGREGVELGVLGIELSVLSVELGHELGD